MNKNYSGYNPYIKDLKNDNMKEYNSIIESMKGDFNKIYDYLNKNLNSYPQLQIIKKLYNEMNLFTSIISNEKTCSLLTILEKLNIMKLLIDNLKEKDIFNELKFDEKININNFLNFLNENISICKKYKFNSDSFYEEIKRINQISERKPEIKRNKLDNLTFMLLKEMEYSREIKQLIESVRW